MYLTVRRVGHRRPHLDRVVYETDLAEGMYPLRVVLEAMVHREVRDFVSRQQSASWLRALSPDELREGTERGAILPAGREQTWTPNAADATAAVLDAFRDGLVCVFVNDSQVESLDDRVPVSPTAEYVLLRLTPLIGGRR